MTHEERRMNCEEMAALGFDFDREAANVNGAERAAAEEHVRACSACAAQMESWRELRGRLSELARETQAAQASPRVEIELRRKVMRLGYEHRRKRMRTAVAVLGLAAAAVAAAAVIRSRMQPAQPLAKVPAVEVSGTGNTGNDVTKQDPAAIAAMSPSDDSAQEKRDRGSGAAAVGEAATTQGEFTLLPGSLSFPSDDAAIVHVRMQRGALGALGLPVNEEKSSEWILVDLLVSTDGQPQAIRLSR
jgi:hypothetical protein